MSFSWENESNPEMKKQIKEVLKFVENNFRETLTESKVACIDGRIEAGQSGGAVRITGGDFGIEAPIVVLAEKKGLLISPEGIHARYIEALRHKGTKRDGRYYEHTSCGHIGRLIEASESLRKLQSLVLVDEGRLSMVPVQGDHKEKGIIFVKDLDWSINSKDPKTGEMYFVADLGRTKQAIERLVPWLAIPVSVDEVWKKYMEDTNSTARYLAQHLGRSLPQFEASRKNGKFNIEYKGEISPLA